jgi:myo-inositol-1(or 4)-monophosphatase
MTPADSQPTLDGRADSGADSGVNEAELLALAVRLAQEAGRLIVDGRTHGLANIDAKSSPTDLVTAMDRAAEELIVSGITAVRPDDGFIGEEGTTTTGTTSVQWLIDPIDGTTNYVYDFPGYSVSIAARINGALAIGAVVDVAMGRTYQARRGHGAWCDDQPLSIRSAPPLSEALVGTGFGYKRERRAAQAQMLTVLLPAVRDIRRRGSCALDLCMVAAGQLDAYGERGLGPWDFAAGAVIAREAGALVLDLDGHDPDGTFLVAAPPTLWEPLRDLFVSAGARELP